MKKFIISGSLLALMFALVFSPIAAQAKSKNKDNDDNHKNKKENTCKVAWGHLIAPGWVKKHGVALNDLENCKGKIPKGIWKKLYGNINWYHDHDGNNGNPNDTTAPLVSTNVVSNISNNSATVTVTSNEDVKTKVTYGLNTSYGTSSNTSNSFAATQPTTLIGLAPNTVYHYFVTLTDKSGNVKMSDDATFTTTNTGDTTAPTISALSTTNVTSTGATISWTTNEAAGTEIYYGTTTSYGTSVIDATLVASHSKTLSSLTPNTTYHFQVVSKDAANNAITSTDQTFTTLAADSTAPMITGVTVTNLTSASAMISWTTNENTSSKIYYSTTTPVNKVTAGSVSDANFVTGHSQTIGGLSANTHYYFLIESKDASNNMTTATEGAFTTGM